MRQLIIHVAGGRGSDVVETVKSHDALGVVKWEAQNEEQRTEVVSVQISNRAVGPLLEALEGLPELTVTLFPHEIISFMSPPSKAPTHLVNLEARSPLEIFLHSLQSIGKWPGFLAYAVAGAVVVWIAFFTNSVFLLLAAMLIAPFAGPAMNVAVATARGDGALLRTSLLRYGAAIAVTAAVTGALALIVGQTEVSNLMVSVSRVSAVAFLLPLTAGAAGALNLVQTDRSSLVSGAAVGTLVAASLAPPAGLIGTSLAMQTWDIAHNALFLLLLQLVGINLGGSAVFRIYGLSLQLVRYSRGRRRLFYVSVAGALVLMGGLLAWQFSGPLRLQRTSEGAFAAQTIRQVIRESDLVKPLEVEARFPHDEDGDATLLATIFVQTLPEVKASTPVIAGRLEFAIRQRLMREHPDIIPLIEINVFKAPLGTGSN